MPVTRAALDSASRAALRAILAVRPEAQAVEYPALVPEHSGTSDPPLLTAAEQLEDGPMRAIPVAESSVGFSAFLDGTQQARILAWNDGVPYVFGTGAAAVRVRRDRKLRSWERTSPAVERRLYLPGAYIAGLGEDISGLAVVDTTAPDLGAVPSRHPAALLERALTCLQRDRQRLERYQAEAWVAAEEGVLCADGPLPAGGPARDSVRVIGAVKSHRTLYADGAALDVVLSLRAMERSPVFAVADGGRALVASWYVRTRDPRGRDSLWGLVRLESAIVADVAARADLVSRWLLAENAPLALPDARWDKMTYGVRDCEAFLRAVS
ncbi:MAG TPA: hypothetical protein VMM17_07610 [Gemmatimonadaceae bacterium]|nr:hypothetical protein [Gemmatimonadaceae bacterium]